MATLTFLLAGFFLLGINYMISAIAHHFQSSYQEVPLQTL